MPINIPEGLPAAEAFQREGIFFMTDSRARTQDIRPLRILLLNLMPKKIETETQLLRLVGNTPVQADIELLQMVSHVSKNTPSDHLLKFYKCFQDVRGDFFDGMIITGAPVETLPFEEVDYWPELCEVMDWSRTHVYSSMHICWGAQAALYHHYGIPKYPLGQKMFGVFPHQVLNPRHMLTRGFDDWFLAPHSRHTGVREEDFQGEGIPELLAVSGEAGVYLAASRDGRQIFVLGHPEYDRDTLAKEYFRDRDKGLPIRLPNGYFPEDNPEETPRHVWRSHANLLYSNWLNYFVYQRTPYDLSQLSAAGQGGCPAGCGR